MVQKQAVIVTASTPIKTGIELNLTYMMKVVHINFASKPKITPYRLMVHRQHRVALGSHHRCLGAKMLYRPSSYSHYSSWCRSAFPAALSEDDFVTTMVLTLVSA
jgi:hypothetical protein